jgi:hypothetical protein
VYFVFDVSLSHILHLLLFCFGFDDKYPFFPCRGGSFFAKGLRSVFVLVLSICNVTISIQKKSQIQFLKLM